MSEVEACGSMWCQVPILVLVRVTLLSGDDHCGFIQGSQVNVRIEPVADAAESPAVRGFLHRPTAVPRASLVLTHGAGSNCEAPLLIALAEAFAGRGIATLRCDLPYRQQRRYGPPRGTGTEDQAGLRRAVEFMRGLSSGPAFLGGQSYGGRQATMLAGSETNVADGLLILSYPLHPPGKPTQLRITHLSQIQMPTLFVSGAQDPFGSPEEMRVAIARIPARVSFISIESVGHDLGFGRGSRRCAELPELIVHGFEELFALA